MKLGGWCPSYLFGQGLSLLWNVTKSRLAGQQVLGIQLFLPPISPSLELQAGPF